MTLDQLIAQVRGTIADLANKRAALTADLAAQRDAATPDESRVDALIAERDALDPQLSAAQERLAQLEDEKARDDAAASLASRYGITEQRETASVSVTSEPAVYRKDTRESWVRDLFYGSLRGDVNAMDRLRRNNAQSLEHYVSEGIEARALSTSDGGIGEFVPPVWLFSEYVPFARAGRVAADRVRTMALPGGTDSISVPIITGGTSVAEQATQGNPLSDTDMTSTSTTAAVTTEGGVQTISLQLLEQSPIAVDTIVFADLAAALAQRVDVFTLSANGTNKKGILNVSGLNAVTYTDATPTVPKVWPKVIDAKRQIHAGRFLPAREVLMHPNRWAWFEAALDGNGRPFITDATSVLPALATTNGQAVPEGYAGTLRGVPLPVFLDANVPTNLGAGTNEDRIIVWRPEDVVLFESAPRASVHYDTKAKEAQVVVRLYEYLALLSGRAPKAISVISGTGLAAPTF